MTIRVDRAVTDVVPQPETLAETDGADPRFDELQQLRDALRRLERLEKRIRAEGFDD